MNKVFIFLTLLGILAACGARTSATIASIPADTPQCPDACRKMRALGCDQGDPLHMSLRQYNLFIQNELEVVPAENLPCDPPSPNGGVCLPCENFCQYEQTHGHELKPGCLVNITTCAEISTKCGA